MKNHSLRSLAIRAVCTGVVAAATLAQSPGGTYVVFRVGDGTGTRTSSATKCYWDTFDQNWNLLWKTPAYVTPSGSNVAFTVSGTATSEGSLSLSADGLYLVCGGYATAPGLANVSTSTSAAVPRVIARLDMNGVLDTSTTLGTAFSGANIRSVASPDGVQFYATGSGGGVQYATLGGSSATQINSAAPTNLRVANIFNGQLYVSAASGAFQGIGTVGTGLPTTGGQVPALLSGFPTASGPSSYDYYFADANTVYVADDRSRVAGGGIQKWTANLAGVWSLQYTLNVSATDGCRSVTGFNIGGAVSLVATTAPASLTASNQLVAVDDLGPSSPFNVRATSPTDTVFRGVRYIPYPSTVDVVGVGSPSSGGTPTIASVGRPSIGSVWGLSSSNWPLSTFGVLMLTVGPLLPGIPLAPLGGQPGALLYVSLPETYSFLVFSAGTGGSASLNIPANASLLGLEAGGQWFVFDASLPYPLQFATSPGASIKIGN